jgi:hypothetical protein
MCEYPPIDYQHSASAFFLSWVPINPSTHLRIPLFGHLFAIFLNAKTFLGGFSVGLLLLMIIAKTGILSLVCIQ